jgi:hypothetical protein
VLDEQFEELQADFEEFFDAGVRVLLRTFDKRIGRQAGRLQQMPTVVTRAQGVACNESIATASGRINLVE